jgi:hypothetical protein
MTGDGILGHEFDITLQFFLHAVPSPFYWRILKKTILFCGLKTPYKKSAKQKTRVYSCKAFWRTENFRKPDKNSIL